MAVHANYKIYDPQQPLTNQLTPLSEGKTKILNIGDYQYKKGAVTFTPLKMNEIFLHISLKLNTRLETFREGCFYTLRPYDEYTLDIKIEGDIDENEEREFNGVSSENVQTTIVKIYQRSLLKQ